MLPGEATVVHCKFDGQKPSFTFEDSLLNEINVYYDQKTKILGRRGQYDFYGRSTLDGTLSEQMGHSVFDSILLQLNSLLKHTATEKHFPHWFIQYEQKNIKIRDLTFRKGLPIVRHPIRLSG